MFIEKFPIFILRPLASVAKHFPRQIMNLRYRRMTGGDSIDWTSPSELQQMILSRYFDHCEDPMTIDLFAMCADKLTSRDYVREKVGYDCAPGLLGAWEKVGDIEWEKLPKKFAIKTNNSCGTNIIIRDKSKMNRAKESAKLKRWLEFPYSHLTGQPHYSHIKPMILAEELLILKDNPQGLPQDYKFFCFNGKPQFILYYEDRSVNSHLTPNMAFDLDWSPIPEAVRRPVDHAIPKPTCLEEMISIATKLSSDLEFARIDLYDINGRPVFGEISLTPDVIINFTEDFRKQALKYFDKQ